jgi:prepilin-type N-terminal cleavage/methylation domain-containing protein
MKPRSRRAAFSLIEVLAVIVVIVVLAGMFVGPAHEGAHPQRIKCVNNLKNVGLAFRIFATDNGDRFPGDILTSNVTDLASIRIEQIYGYLSNELSTPKILYCPADTGRRPAESFTNFTAKNISYFASLTADEPRPQSFLAGDRSILVDGKPAPRLLILSTNAALSWSKEMHDGQGDIVMGDGSVQQMSSSRLKSSLPDALDRSTTDYLVFPH